MFSQVICDTISAWSHSIFAFVPVCRADFTIFFKELQCINHAQSFVHTPAQRQVIDDTMPDNSLFVNKEQSPQSYFFAK